MYKTVLWNYYPLKKQSDSSLPFFKTSCLWNTDIITAFLNDWRTFTKDVVYRKMQFRSFILI